MRKRIFDIIDVPEGIKVEVTGKNLKLSKGNEIIEKELSYPAKYENNKLH